MGDPQAKPLSPSPHGAQAARARTCNWPLLRCGTAASDAARLQERIERWRDAVLRPAAQRTAAALAAYRASQLALAALFESRHAEVEAQQKLLALERDLARTRARLAYTPITEGAQR